MFDIIFFKIVKVGIWCIRDTCIFCWRCDFICFRIFCLKYWFFNVEGEGFQQRWRGVILSGFVSFRLSIGVYCWIGLALLREECVTKVEHDFLILINVNSIRIDSLQIYQWKQSISDVECTYVIGTDWYWFVLWPWRDCYEN